MAQIGRIFRVGPAHQPGADPGQLAQFLLDWREITEGTDIVGGRAGDTGLDQPAPVAAKIVSGDWKRSSRSRAMRGPTP